MTFDEWWERELERDYSSYTEGIARGAWNYQQARIEALEAQLTALRESNRVAMAEAYRCGYEAAKLENQK